MADLTRVTIEYPNGVTDLAAEMISLGGGRYRLAHDPVWSMSAATEDELRDLPGFGDTIEADELAGGGLRYSRVVERAKLRRIELLVTKDVADSEPMRRILGKVESEGGHWERVFGGLVILLIPEDSSYDPSEELELLARDA